MSSHKMLEGRRFKYIKGGMYTLNFMVALLGLALGGVGLWIRIDFKPEKYQKVLDPIFKLCEEKDDNFDFTIRVHMDTIAYFLIFLGVSIVGMSCVGVCGTIRERQALLGMFCILLFTIFAILLTAGIQAMVRKDSFMECEHSISDSLLDAVHRYYVDDQKAEFMDQVQTYVGCCGARGALDYDMARGVPESCSYGEVSKTTKNEQSNTSRSGVVYTACDQAIKDFFRAITDNMIMILVVSFCIGLFTVIGMGMSAYLFASLRAAKEKL